MMLTIQRYYAEDFAAAHRVREDRGGPAAVQRGLRDARRARVVLALATAAVYGRAHGRSSEPSTTRSSRTVREAACGAGSRSAPENFEHMQLLVEAECARLRGARIEAADLYDRAIAAARAQGFLNIEALADRARRAFLAPRRQAGLRRIYSRRRCDAYEAWGAHGKVADLVAKHGLNAAGSATVSVTAGSTTLGSVRGALGLRSTSRRC